MRATPADATGPVSTKGSQVAVRVRLTPRAGRTAIQGVEKDALGVARLQVKVSEPPEDGKANAALLALLAKAWRLPKSSLSIAAGASHRDKTIHVAGDPAQVMASLGSWLETQHGR